MLHKANRLKKKNDFKALFKHGKGAEDKFLAVRFAPNGLKTSRFGFIVSQKVSKKAGVRNKIRRRLSEAVKSDMESVKTGLDIALIGLAGLENKSFLEIKAILYNLLKRVKILNV
jgi:ribonuclease P protein component